MTLVKLGQFLTKFPLIVVTVDGIVTLVKPVQFQKALLSMVLTIYVTPARSKLDKIVTTPVAEGLVSTLATPEPAL